MGVGLIGGGGVGTVNSDDLTAIAAYVLKGKTYIGFDTDDDPGVGTMPNIGTQTSYVAPGGSVVIEKGYHDGNGFVYGSPLSGYTQGTATAGTILLNKKLWVNGVLVTGTLPNVGAQNATLDCGGSVVITRGYHNGNGVVTVNTLASQTSGTATPGRVLNGKTIWVDGVKITGTMTNVGAQTATLTPAKDSTVSVTITQGYHNGNGVISGATLASQTSSANATAAMIRNGYTCWVNGRRITGTMADQAAKTITPGASSQTIKAGVYTAGAIVMVGDSDLVASNIKKGVTIFGVTGTWEGLS